MQLEKISTTRDETINMYEELFSKKTLENEIPESSSSTSPEKEIEKTEESVPNTKMTEKVSNEDLSNSLLNKIKNKIKVNSKKINVKYLVMGLLVGIITNMSVYHYQSITLQNNSQKLATGLVYNLSENNDLQQIASNIYLGMKENGWEPTIKMSNANAFVFELDKGGEFTITKSTDVISTKFHVSVNNFSQEMITALRIQLEPHKIGGTKNYINNKTYNSKTGTISFDIEKINSPNLDIPIMIPNVNSMPIYPPLNAIPELPPLPTPQYYNNKSIDPQIINIPISKELDSKMVKLIKKDYDNKLENKNNENKSK